MIVQVHSQFPAWDKHDAIAQAEEVWRKFTGNPEDNLPWATTLHVQPAEAVPTSPDDINVTKDPRPFFVDLIIKETKPEMKAPPGV